MLAAYACPDPDDERIIAHGQSADPTQHIRTQTSAQKPPVVPPIYTATDLCEPHPGSHPIEILLSEVVTRGSALMARKYASTVSRKLGCTTLIQLQSEQRILEIFAAKGETPQVKGAYSHDVTSLVSWAASFSKRVIIFCPSPEDITKTLAWNRPIRLLSQSNNTGVVQTYRLFKKIVNTSREQQATVPSTGLVLITQDSSETPRLYERIKSTAQRFLNANLVLSEVIPYARNTHGTIRMQFVLPSTTQVDEVMNALGRDPTAE